MKNLHGVEIISFAENILPGTTYTIEKLVNFLTLSGSPSKVLIRVSTGKFFLLCALPVDEIANWSETDAVAEIDKIVGANDDLRQTGFLFRSRSGVNYAVAVSNFSTASCNLSLYEDKLDMSASDEDSSTPHSCLLKLFRHDYQPVVEEGESKGFQISRAKRLVIRYLALALVVFLLLSFSAFFLPQQSHPWQRFSEVLGSNGPQYQLQLKPENVTQWIAQEKDTMDSKWYLRIDDGSIYPKALLEDKEIEYQAWLDERYPEVSTIKNTGRYLEPDFLAHPDVNDMLIDKYFHISHCVHSMRRYWVAKETGHHICPMDLSSWHMNHCFEDILLPWATPAGPRGTVPVEFTDLTPYNISWITRVCF